jgi:hypothetical protein
MVWTVLEIKKSINQILKEIMSPNNQILSDAQLEGSLTLKYSDFAKEFPFLLKKMAKREELEYLDVMIQGITDIESGDKKQTDIENDIGDELAEKLFYPTLDPKQANEIRGKVAQEKIKRSS